MAHHHATNITTTPMMIEELPAPAWQVLAACLAPRDLAFLRLAGRTICARATDAAPAITLRLSGGSSTDAGSPSQQQQQLRAWRAATRRLDGVPGVTLLISGALSSGAWSAAVNTLARRGNVRRLQLEAAAAAGSGTTTDSRSSVPSLLPLRQLLPDLQALSVSGVAVGSDLGAGLAALLQPADARDPAAQAGTSDVTRQWTQLHSLTLACPWTPSGSVRDTAAFARALLALPAALPCLQHLTLALPAVAAPPASPHPPHARLTGAQAARAALCAQADAVAALAVAVSQLQCLHTLTVNRLPDIWAPAATAATHASAHVTSQAAADAITAAAAAHGMPDSALHSLHSLAGWLAETSALRSLRLELAGGACHMAFSNSRRGCDARAASEEGLLPAEVALSHHAGLLPAAGWGAAACSKAAPALLPQLCRQLACYSGSQPAAQLHLARIVSLQAALQPQQLASTRAALSALPALRHLKLTLLATSSRSRPAGLDALAAAAAAGSRLTSLVLLPGLGRAELTPASLLPLTAAAGGPGSTLRRLKLVGCFDATTTGGSSNGTPACWGVLAQLPALRALAIQQLGPHLLELPVGSLPPTLESLDGRRLHLTATASAAALQPPSAIGRPCLRALHLQDSRLDSAAVHSLASTHLRTLSVAATEVAGGWKAAAAAWPSLQELTAWCPRAAAPGKGGTSSSTARGQPAASSSVAQPGAAPPTTDAAAATVGAEALVEAACGFPQLRSLELQHMPMLSRHALDTLLQRLPQLEQLAISAQRVDFDEQQQQQPARNSLRSVRLRLPVRLQQQHPALGHLLQHPDTPAAAATDGAGGEQTATGVAQAVQARLADSLPWANVHVTSDVCLLR